MMTFSVTARLSASCLAAALIVAEGAAWAQSAPEAAEGEPLTFTHVLDNEPLDVLTPREGEEFTEAVKAFHVTAENAYSGDDDAIAEGKEVFVGTCRGCHGTDGAGGMGPALDDDNVRRERAATEKGMFEIIYGGAAGAMQPFGKRFDQDEILRVMAYIETLGDAE